MITVREVRTSRDIKEFIELPLRMYKNVWQFVPPLYADEKKLLRSGGCTSVADAVFYLAEKDGRTVGRIQGIHQKQYNDLHGTKELRFTRFDAIDDPEVSRALFSALEAWGRERGLTDIVGPLGYSDLDREGLLIEGFSENSTFEEQYNFDYYGALIEDAGFKKDLDWLEFELTAPEKKNPMLERVAQRALELNGLHIADTNMPKKKYIERYGDSFFDCLDECYSKLYGTVPLTPEQRREILDQFMLIVNIKLAVFICDKDDKVVAFGLCLPGIGDAVKKSGGRLTLPALIKLFSAAARPKVMDLALIAVRPEYQSSGINAVLINGLVDMLCSGVVERCETNLNLETNTAVMSQWKYFTARQHKRRRAYRKTLE
ncbi:MAG: hypothetical protein IKC32_06020 [Clostridia bacterium]|nr:hypothetical protein [Clostridia bacterium]